MGPPRRACSGRGVPRRSGAPAGSRGSWGRGAYGARTSWPGGRSRCLLVGDVDGGGIQRIRDPANVLVAQPGKAALHAGEVTLIDPGQGGELCKAHMKSLPSVADSAGVRSHASETSPPVHVKQALALRQCSFLKRPLTGVHPTYRYAPCAPCNPNAPFESPTAGQTAQSPLGGCMEVVHDGEPWSEIGDGSAGHSQRPGPRQASPRSRSPSDCTSAAHPCRPSSVDASRTARPSRKSLRPCAPTPAWSAGPKSPPT